ncbi:MAG TPA: threonine synthase [Burkholderiales bacterium]|nr:threonine synthase [Burkholderiales bacterium]
MSLRYVSTRGGVKPCGFEDALFAGLAPDGGLYLPERWPRLDRDELAALQGASYQEVAARILAPFVEGDLSEAELRRLIARAYAGFDHVAVAPLCQFGPNEWLLELFHGPTLAFKDIALQLLGMLFEHFLARRERAITIVGATSGDTGSAAIAACAGRAQMAIVILHPHGRISEVQRRQMTTVAAGNVHNVAIEGTFDDCQALVKAMFNDAAFRARLNLAAINSINWGRIMAQAVYYVSAALALGSPWRRVAFAVPTGNFGDVYAGYVAHKLGLPIAQLIVATNRNDILARFFESGTYRAGAVAPTMSPSMDIQVASNFERLLYDLYEGDGAEVRHLLDQFAAHKRMRVSDEALGRACELFAAARVDEEETAATMAEVRQATGELVDPHTAVGIHAGRARRLDPKVPLIALATAHPAKFPEAVHKATGVRPGLPDRLANLYERPERCAVLPNDLGAVQRHIEELVMESA